MLHSVIPTKNKLATFYMHTEQQKKFSNIPQTPIKIRKLVSSIKNKQHYSVIM